MHPAIGERELMNQALRALKATTGIDAKIAKREVDVEVNGIGNHRVDALIDIDAAKGKHRFAAEIKRVARAEILAQLRARWPKKPRFPLMVITPYMTAHLAEKCREIGLFFIDAVGNAISEIIIFLSMSLAASKLSNRGGWRPTAERTLRGSGSCSPSSVVPTR